MRAVDKCTKCGSGAIAQRAMVVDRTDSGELALQLRVDANPEALVFKKSAAAACTHLFVRRADTWNFMRTIRRRCMAHSWRHSRMRHRLRRAEVSFAPTGLTFSSDYPGLTPWASFWRPLRG